jgi:predicted transposase YbfD/YdcC
VTLYSAALGVAISQACYATGENHERAVLRQLLGELDLNGVLIQADALHTQKPILRSLRKNRLNSRISRSYELIALCSG